MYQLGGGLPGGSGDAGGDVWPGWADDKDVKILKARYHYSD